ncbi:MAG: hypothetical protein EBS05_08125 [Proteobacteria bacterium]|nr:hypothetical protein [Pseudomonadota bacterium]
MTTSLSSDQPTFALRRLPEGTVEVAFRGAFPHPHWLAYLLRGLTDRQVSLVSGRAVQNDALGWEARVVLDFQRSQLRPDQVDYLALALQRPAITAFTTPQLSTFTIVRRKDLQLGLHLEAPDQVGFLGGLLTRVSSLGLFPSEMEIATVGGCIKDRIVLRGIMTKAPTEMVQKSLEAICRLMAVPAVTPATAARVGAAY